MVEATNEVDGKMGEIEEQSGWTSTILAMFFSFQQPNFTLLICPINNLFVYFLEDFGLSQCCLGDLVDMAVWCCVQVKYACFGLGDRDSSPSI